MSIDKRKLEINLKSGISAEEDKFVITGHTLSRRAALAGATALGASLWLGQLARAENTGGTVRNKETGRSCSSATGFRIPLIPGADR